MSAQVRSRVLVYEAVQIEGKVIGRTIDVASGNVKSCFDARMDRSSIRTVASRKMQLYSFVKRLHKVQLGRNLGWSAREQLYMKCIVPLAFTVQGVLACETYMKSHFYATEMSRQEFEASKGDIEGS